MNFFKDLNIVYQAGNKECYSVRESEIKNQHWHQELAVSSVEKIQKNSTSTIGVIGYVCDAGVQRNQGRIGARKGPRFMRNKLGKLPVHFKNKNIIDFGDVICIDDYLEDCQRALSKSISALIKNNIFPIAIGGGHDIAYANFNGVKDALKNSTKNKIGIINFDAHFDLRAIETLPNSGTPFYQILNENKTTTYFAIGIQQQSNSKELFEIAKKNDVSYVLNFDCETFSKVLKNKLTAFVKKADYLYITIDLDGFSSAFAPGVSAPSPLGFNPNFVYQVLKFLFKSKKVISCDIAELNPDYDIDDSTAKLGARLLDYIVQNT